jgi:hypothetical protein
MSNVYVGVESVPLPDGTRTKTPLYVPGLPFFVSGRCWREFKGLGLGLGLGLRFQSLLGMVRLISTEIEYQYVIPAIDRVLLVSWLLKDFGWMSTNYYLGISFLDGDD